MPNSSRGAEADRGQRRATFQRSNSRETKRMLVQAAMALWRTKGYATTTVAEICTAAGVSKALFYFYFPRKEDVLFEVGVMSTQSAQRAIHRLLTKPYEMDAVIRAALTAFEESMVSGGGRHWAAGAFGKRSFAEVVTADIGTLINGYVRS